MKLIPENILQPLKEKGFTGETFCEAVDFFRDENNIFIQYYWMIDEAANRVVFYFKIDYMYGYRDKEKTYADWAKRNQEVKVEKCFDEPNECQIKSIIYATELL